MAPSRKTDAGIQGIGSARRWLAACTLALLAACGAEAGGVPDGDPPPKEQEEEEEEPHPDPLGLAACELPVGSLADATELPGLSWSDGGEEHAALCGFRALDAALEGKRIICTGENDHGVAQSTRWHAALARYLVHTAGVRVIAYEADAAGIAHWDRYLHGGDAADLEAGFRGMGGTLAGSVQAEWFLEAMREVQAELPEGERLRLTGYDIAVQPDETIAALRHFLERVAPDELDRWLDAWRTSDYVAAAEEADLLLQQIEAEHDAYVAVVGEERWRAARTDAANLRDGFLFTEFYRKGDFGGGNATHREPGMIRNVEELMAALPEDENLLLIGHNMHCARAMPASGARSIRESPAVGTHLARSSTWGSKYLMLAQIYERGSHLTQSLRVEEFDSAEESLSGELERLTDAPALLIGTEASQPPMDGYQDLAPFGMSGFPIIPAYQFDGILWVREVTETAIR